MKEYCFIKDVNEHERPCFYCCSTFHRVFNMSKASTKKMSVIKFISQPFMKMYVYILGSNCLRLITKQLFFLSEIIETKVAMHRKDLQRNTQCSL